MKQGGFVMATPLPPVITEAQYARIHAHAWLNADFKAAYEKDPHGALSPDIRAEFGIDPDARFMDLTDAAYYGGVDFSKYSPDQLAELYRNGTVDGEQKLLQPSEWRPPKSATIPIDQGPDALSRGDWTRIYAYMWYQIKAANDTRLKDLFELDPAKAVSEIAPKLQLSKKYQYGVTPIITIGDPPKEPVRFEDIRGDADAKGYRYYTRYCCI
jgi:hypothetical protein